MSVQDQKFPRALRKEPYMSAKQLEYFRNTLNVWRLELIEGFDRTVKNLNLETVQMADEHDRASREEHFNVELRARDRERKLLNKVESALNLIENRQYGFCNECDNEIGLDRLNARPTATLCISCKEFQERLE